MTSTTKAPNPSPSSFRYSSGIRRSSSGSDSHHHHQHQHQHQHTRDDPVHDNDPLSVLLNEDANDGFRIGRCLNVALSDAVRRGKRKQQQQKQGDVGVGVGQENKGDEGDGYNPLNLNDLNVDPVTVTVSVGDTDTVPVAEISDEALASVALRLQMETQRCHDEVSRVGAELQALVPRCVADLRRLSAGLGGMAEDARHLLQASSSSSSSNEDGMIRSSPTTAKLETLHALRLNLTCTLRILRATATWDAILTGGGAGAGGLSSHLSAGRLTEAVDAVGDLERGSRALRGMPGVEERARVLETSRQRVEALLRPRLLSALESNRDNDGNGVDGMVVVDDDLLQRTFVLYQRLGRPEAFTEEFVRTRPASVHRAWFSFSPRLPTTSTSTGTGITNDTTNTSSSIATNEEDGGDMGFDTTTDDLSSPMAPTPAPPPTVAFPEFLRSWHARTLNLLEAERRRSELVFGRMDAPAVTLRVLRECFRPLQTSYRSRLSGLLLLTTPTPGKGNGIGNGKGGGWSDLCDAYDQTLDFLERSSLLLEHHDIDSNFDSNNNIDSNSNSNDVYDNDKEENDHTAAKRLAFLEVASPYADFRRESAARERSYSAPMVEALTRKIRTLGMDGLRETTASSLEPLAAGIFAIVEGALRRHELFHCGHAALDAASVLDGLLTSHTTELTLAVGSLTVSSVSTAPATDGDDRRVASALELLRVVGGFLVKAHGFEADARRRLLDWTKVSLSLTKGNSGNEESVFHDDHVLTSMTTISSRGNQKAKTREERRREIAVHLATYDPPSSLLPNEAINDFENEFGVVEGDGPSKKTFKSKNKETSNGNAPVVVLPKFRMPTDGLASKGRSTVYEILCAVPRAALAGVSWDGARGGGDGSLPQASVTTVGEHLLSLVQALESFVDVDGTNDGTGTTTGVAATTLAFARRVGIPRAPWADLWRDLMSSSSSYSSSISAGGVDDTATIAWEGTSSAWADLRDGDYDVADQDVAVDDATAFCNEWLDAIGSAVTVRILQRILSSSSTTTTSSKRRPFAITTTTTVEGQRLDQLATDLGYLGNVLAALGVPGHPHPLLRRCEKMATVDTSVLIEALSPTTTVTTATATTTTATATFVTLQMDRCIASLRHLNVSPVPPS